jgi:hypothetical protein
MTRTVSFSLLLFTMLMGLSGPQTALAVSGMSSGRGAAAAAQKGDVEIARLRDWVPSQRYLLQSRWRIGS